MLLLLFLCIITTIQTDASLQKTNHVTMSTTKNLSDKSSCSSWDEIDQNPYETLELEESVIRRGLELNNNSAVAGFLIELLRSIYVNEQYDPETPTNKNSPQTKFIIELSQKIVGELYTMNPTECSFPFNNILLNLLTDAECIYSRIISREILIQKHHRDIYKKYNLTITEF